MILERFGAVGFHFIDAVVPPTSLLHGAGHEHRTSDYDWENGDRQGEMYLFQYTLSGCGKLRYGGQFYDVPAGTGFLLHLPGEERYFLPQNVPDGWRFAWMMFSGAAIEPYCRKLQEQLGVLYSLPENSPAIGALTTLCAQALAGHVDNPFVAAELVYRFVCRLSDCLLNPKRTLSPRVEAALRILGEEYATLEGVATLPARLNVSAGHLSREFAAQTGKTLMDTLTRIRLQQAAVLLRDCSLSIDEVAVRCGFSCGNYFSKVFRQAFSLSPDTFRKDAVARDYSDIFVAF